MRRWHHYPTELSSIAVSKETLKKLRTSGAPELKSLQQKNFRNFGGFRVMITSASTSTRKSLNILFAIVHFFANPLKLGGKFLFSFHISNAIEQQNFHCCNLSMSKT